MQNIFIKNKVELLYKQGLSLTNIEKILKLENIKISRQWISRYLKSINIEVINYQNISKFNENYFDIINTEEKSYWLGFLYADGSISSNSNSIELSLKLSDYNHLEKFKKSLNCELNVKKDSFRCRFTVTNKNLKSKLKDLGCVSRKSLILTFPNENQVPNSLINHFIRGYFDGDGHIGYSNNGNRPQFSLLGTKEFLEKLCEICNLPLNIKKDKRHLNNTYYINYFGKNSINFLNFIYDNSNIYLDRKYNTYKNSFAVLSRNI